MSFKPSYPQQQLWTCLIVLMLLNIKYVHSIAVKDLSNVNLNGTELLKCTNWKSYILIFKSSCFLNSWPPAFKMRLSSHWDSNFLLMAAWFLFHEALESEYYTEVY